MAGHMIGVFYIMCVCLLFQCSLSYYDRDLELYKDILQLDRLREHHVSEERSSYHFEDYAVDRLEYEVNLLMPNITPHHINDYKCHSVPTPKDESVFIVGFEAKALMGTAHHILLFGCEDPGSDQEVWDCGEMNTEGISQNGPCAGYPSIMYAWAMNAPPFKLPEGVGFEIGGATHIRHLVVQIHYASVAKFKDGSTDTSGLTLSVTNEPQRYIAGTYFMGADGKIPGKSEVRLETACIYNEEQRLVPFAFRVHAHTLGKVISGYRIRDDVWREIGKQDPNLPQMFYPIDKANHIDIEEGDVLAARCTMKNIMDKTVFIGPTMADEMCNFYMMYYTDSQQLPENNVCFNGPDFKWSDYLDNIPDKEASQMTIQNGDSSSEDESKVPASSEEKKD